MEGQIKRGTYFDGQFLQQAEFNDEGDYHRHMRRRINYTLFDQSGVLELTPADLRFTIVSVGAKTFQVQPGTAVSVRTVDAEGKEVVLRDVSPTLDVSGFPAAVTTAWVTIRYLETPVASPPSPGSLLPTRVIEDSIIEVHQGPPPHVDPNPPHEEYIILGKISLAGMTPVYGTDRMIAHLRSGLLGGIATSPAPAVTGINVNTGAQGAVITALITGTNLSGATGVTFSSTGVTAVINAVTATSISVTLTIAGTAPVGTRTFTVSTPSGTATSAGIAGAAFQVTVPAPVLLASIPTVTTVEFSPGSGRNSDPITIYGRNFRVDLPTNPTVEVVDGGGNRLNLFAVTSITPRTAGAVQYEEMIATVGPGTAAITAGRFRVTTTGGSALSTGFFTLRP